MIVVKGTEYRHTKRGWFVVVDRIANGNVYYTATAGTVEGCTGACELTLFTKTYDEEPF